VEFLRKERRFIRAKKGQNCFGIEKEIHIASRRLQADTDITNFVIFGEISHGFDLLLDRGRR
jgi:hypothetical protein